MKRWTALAIPLVALALSTLISYWSLENNRQMARQTAELSRGEAVIKTWDLAARVRGDAYDSTFDSMQSAFDPAGRGDKAEMKKELNRFRTNLFRLEPLIDNVDARKQLWHEYADFQALCSEVGTVPQPTAQKRFETLRDNVHEQLYDVLFGKTVAEVKAVAALKP